MSNDLTDAALVHQTVDAEQALLYKVKMDFGDPRMPAARRGDDRTLGEGEGAADDALTVGSAERRRRATRQRRSE